MPRCSQISSASSCELLDELLGVTAAICIISIRFLEPLEMDMAKKAKKAKKAKRKSKKK